MIRWRHPTRQQQLKSWRWFSCTLIRSNFIWINWDRQFSWRIVYFNVIQKSRYQHHGMFIIYKNDAPHSLSFPGFLCKQSVSCVRAGGFYVCTPIIKLETMFWNTTELMHCRERAIHSNVSYLHRHPLVTPLPHIGSSKYTHMKTRKCKTPSLCLMMSKKW